MCNVYGGKILGNCKGDKLSLLNRAAYASPQQACTPAARKGVVLSKNVVEGRKFDVPYGLQIFPLNTGPMASGASLRTLLPTRDRCCAFQTPVQWVQKRR